MSLPVVLANIYEDAGVVFTATTEDAAFPAANLASPYAPFRPWRSTSTAFHQITIDNGTAKPVNAVGAIRGNFIASRFFADDAPTFNSGVAGAAQYDSGAITLAESLNGRHHASKLLGLTVTRRYHAWHVSGTPIATDEHAAGAGYFILGGLCAGMLATVPRHILDRPELDRVEPTERLVLPSGAAQVSIMGRMFITLTARRQAWNDAGGLDTELRQWLALDRAWFAADHALVLPTPEVASDAYIMRRVKGWSGAWGRAYSEGDLTLEEVIAG